MFNIYETFDDNARRNVFGAPDDWMINGVLHWPPKYMSKKINLLRKSKQAPGKDWYRILNFKILKSNIRKPQNVIYPHEILEILMI